MVAETYVPDAGDLVWLDFDPRSGREQAGRRPALVVSPKAYNQSAGLALVCPVTSRTKGYPFEVPMPRTAGIEGVILADHVKSADWRARRAERIGRAPPSIINRVRERIALLIAP